MLRLSLLWLTLKKKKNLKDPWDLDCDHLALCKEISQVLARGILDENKIRIKLSKLLIQIGKLTIFQTKVLSISERLGLF